MQHASLKRELIAAIVIATDVSAWAQDAERGADGGRVEFLSKCAECHGADGRGEGVISGKLKRKPADLTLLAKRNNGVFSPDAIAGTIDGRGANRAAHGGAEMPIWGCRQGPPPAARKKSYQPKPIDALLDRPCDAEEVVQKRIQDVVGYLERIQEK